MTPSGPTQAEGGPLHHDIGLSLIALSALALARWHGAHLQRPEISGPFLLDDALGLAWHTGWVLLMLAVVSVSVSALVSMSAAWVSAATEATSAGAVGSKGSASEKVSCTREAEAWPGWAWAGPALRASAGWRPGR